MGGFRPFVATVANGEVAPGAVVSAAAIVAVPSTRSGHPAAMANPYDAKQAIG